MESIDLQVEKEEVEEEEKYEDAPIACLLPDKEVGRREEELAEIFGSALEERELADGYGFRFEADYALGLNLLELINFERECCPFFRFEIVFEPEKGPMWLNIRGPEGTKDFVRGAFA